MRLSKLACWNIAWLFIILLFAVGILWLQHAFREHIEFADWPDPAHPSTSRADAWHGGQFLGRQASRIRRVERWRGKYLDAMDISFYACVPMPQQDFEHTLQVWRTRPEYKFARFDSSVDRAMPVRPTWFPKPTSQTYVGTVKEAPSNWSATVYRVEGDDNVYVIE
jgi:hypothetical protein